MSKAEEILKRLNSTTIDMDNDHTEGRKKAAKQWVAHFMAIMELDGLNQCESQSDIEELLIASWEEKESMKDSKVKSFLSKLG